MLCYIKKEYIVLFILILIFILLSVYCSSAALALPLLLSNVSGGNDINTKDVLIVDVANLYVKWYMEKYNKKTPYTSQDDIMKYYLECISDHYDEITDGGKFGEVNYVIKNFRNIPRKGEKMDNKIINKETKEKFKQFVRGRDKASIVLAEDYKNISYEKWISPNLHYLRARDDFLCFKLAQDYKKEYKNPTILSDDNYKDFEQFGYVPKFTVTSYNLNKQSDIKNEIVPRINTLGQKKDYNIMSITLGGDDNEDDIKLISSEYPDKELFKELFKDKSSNVIETVSDLKHKLTYTPGKTCRKYGNHIGQRKLILNEIQFLNKSKSKYCIYPGSAPGNKTHYLSQLFPDIKFILIDPNKFELNVKGSHRDKPHPDIVHITYGYPTKSNRADLSKYSGDIVDYIKNEDYKIFIIEDYMTMDLATKLNCLECDFISDIRSNIYLKDYPTDYDIYWNTSMMYNWIAELKPERSMLKIRMPYGTDKITPKTDSYIMDDFELSKKNGIDFLSDYKKKKFNMSKSTLFIQPWQGHSSSELRMVVEKKDINNIVEYNIGDIEDRLNYYNCINRMWVYHHNPNSSRKLNFCHCNDCALENKIWADYGFNKEETHKAVHHLGKITNRYLTSVHRYPLFDSGLSHERVIAYDRKNINTKKKINKGDYGQSR